jgi:hypothetical protein
VVDETTATTLRDRVFASALRQEAQQEVEQEKLALSFELLRESPGSSPDPWSSELVESLLRQSFELRFRDPQAMRWLAFMETSGTCAVTPGSPTSHSGI